MNSDTDIGDDIAGCKKATEAGASSADLNLITLRAGCHEALHWSRGESAPQEHQFSRHVHRSSRGHHSAAISAGQF
jgi:hypothetical protein